MKCHAELLRRHAALSTDSANWVHVLSQTHGKLDELRREVCAKSPSPNRYVVSGDFASGAAGRQAGGVAP